MKKFRVLDKKRLHFDEYSIYDLIKFDNSENLHYPDGFIVNQSTGLQDKNGKEIYEGDIVSYKFSPMNTGTAEIYWDDEHSRFIYWDTDMFSELQSLLNSDQNYGISKSAMECYFEVIGNIYQNPELIQN